MGCSTRIRYSGMSLFCWTPASRGGNARCRAQVGRGEPRHRGPRPGPPHRQTV